MGIEIRDCGTDRKRIRLAALDMDGTLLRADKTLHPETEGDLAAAKASGIEPVLCTGRAPLELYEYVRELPSVRYGICISGALVATASASAAPWSTIFETGGPSMRIRSAPGGFPF